MKPATLPLLFATLFATLACGNALAERADREDWFARELWPAMGALGLHGITVEEADGAGEEGFNRNLIGGIHDSRHALAITNGAIVNASYV